MSKLINYVLNSKLKDLPREVDLEFKYGRYLVQINFEDYPPYIEVREQRKDEQLYVSTVTIYTPDLESKIIDIVEDAIKLIEKYRHKTPDIVEQAIRALMLTEKYKHEIKKEKEDSQGS